MASPPRGETAAHEADGRRREVHCRREDSRTPEPQIWNEGIRMKRTADAGATQHELASDGQVRPHAGIRHAAAHRRPRRSLNLDAEAENESDSASTTRGRPRNITDTLAERPAIRQLAMFYPEPTEAQPQPTTASCTPNSDTAVTPATSEQTGWSARARLSVPEHKPAARAHPQLPRASEWADATNIAPALLEANQQHRLLLGLSRASIQPVLFRADGTAPNRR